MSFVRWLVRNGSLVWLAALALAALGVHAIFTLPSGIYPEMKFARVVVVTRSGQLSPDLVEAEKTRTGWKMRQERKQCL